MGIDWLRDNGTAQGREEARLFPALCSADFGRLLQSVWEQGFRPYFRSALRHREQLRG